MLGNDNGNLDRRLCQRQIHLAGKTFVGHNGGWLGDFGQSRKITAVTVGGEVFVARVGASDVAAPRHYADIAAGRERAGRPISMADAQTAAICRRHAAIVATRDAGDFAGTGVAVLNPWEPQPPA